MGWGVRDYPSAPLEAPAEFDRCEGRCREDIAKEDNAGACKGPECHREVLCYGCSYECRECERNFCREHIVSTQVGEKVDGFMAIYECDECHAARLQKQREDEEERKAA